MRKRKIAHFIFKKLYFFLNTFYFIYTFKYKSEDIYSLYREARLKLSIKSLVFCLIF